MAGAAEGGANVRCTAILVVGAFGGMSCRRAEPPPAGAPPPARVENRQSEGALATIELTAEAERRLGIETRPAELRALPRERRYAGELLVPPGRSLTLHTPFAAVVRTGAPIVRVGAKVAADAPLLTLEPQPSPERQALSAAERTSVARARADLELLKGELDGQLAALAAEREAERVAAERASALLDAGSGSQRARDEARARLALVEARLAAAAARRDALDVIVLDVDESDRPAAAAVAAPWSATITALHVADGQSVAAGAPLLALADLEQLWVRVEIPSGDAGELAPDAAARVRPLHAPSDAEPIPARPVTAAPRGDFARGTVERLFALAAAPAPMQPGERVSVALPLAGGAEVLTVPAAALVRDVHGGAWVYVRRSERRYARARVEIERVDGEWAVLARGPETGSAVVVAGAAELYGTEFGVGK